MPAGEIRWRRLRRRGSFPQPSADLPQWELQILDSLRSVAQVSAERWVTAGPYSGSSSNAIVSAMGAMQPGWLVKVAPVALTTDLPLPELDRLDAGRMIAVQHTGALRSAIRLGWRGATVAACVSPGQIAQVVWDGASWAALSGGVEWTNVYPTGVCPITSPIPLLTQQIGTWNGLLYCFPTASDTVIWENYHMPPGWIGTDVLPQVTVMPLVSANGTALFNDYWQWWGIDGAPGWANYSSNPPQTNSQAGVQVPITTANYSQPRTIPFSAIPNALSLCSSLQTQIIFSVFRNGASGSDTYTTAYAGGTKNLALTSMALRVQTCSHGATLVA